MRYLLILIFVEIFLFYFILPVAYLVSKEVFPTFTEPIIINFTGITFSLSLLSIFIFFIDIKNNIILNNYCLNF